MDEPPLAVPIEAGGKAGDPPAAERKPVPVTIITGFLGSGKSTLVRHVLTAQHGYRVAVIMNDYGESTGVDNMQSQTFVQEDGGFKGKDGEWIELVNGCMCCSVKSDFAQALETLLQQGDKFDYILIETTGLANPGPIASALWTDEEVEAGVHLDSVVTVVDALNISRQLHEPRAEGTINEAQLQIAYADLVLLNKIDIAKEEAVPRAEADIRAINSTVAVIKTVRSKIDLGLLLNRNGYTHKGEVTLPPITEETDGDNEQQPQQSVDASTEGHSSACHVHACTSRAMSMTHEHADGAHDHKHDSSICTLTLRTNKPLDLDKFKSWVDHLLWDREARPDEIYRCKGVLQVKDDLQRYLFQGVYELYEILPGPKWQADEHRGTAVVLIGRAMKRHLLESTFLECTV